jgi:hypothetical protein
VAGSIEVLSSDSAKGVSAVIKRIAPAVVMIPALNVFIVSPSRVMRE